MKSAALMMVLGLLLAGAGAPPSIFAADQATPQEIVQKVREARELLKGTGETKLSEFNSKDSKWIWKDTYVFVVDCEKVVVVGHPINQNLLNRDMIGLKDIKGNYFFVQYCEMAREDGDGWIEYWWPKPGQEKPSRKISYISRVPDSTLTVGSGIYDETITLDELKRLLNR